MTEMKKIVKIVLYAVPLAMGIATVVLSNLGEADLETTATLLGIGIFCLGLAGLNSSEIESL